MNEFDIDDRELIDQLIATLGALPDSRAHLLQDMSAAGRHRIDAMIEAEIAGNLLLLLVEAKRDIFPRDAREAIWQLRSHQHGNKHADRQVIPFLVAQAISDSARQTLRDERIGYFDRGGTLFLPATGIFVFIDKPVMRKSRKIFDTIFQGQRARVLHAVFDRRDEWVAVKDISRAAGVSPATASQTLSELQKREWVAARGQGPAKVRRLVEPARLVDGWAGFVQGQKPPKLLRFYLPQFDAAELGRRLDTACAQIGVQYAVTGEAAAQSYTPYLTSVSQIRCRLGPAEPRRKVLDYMGAKPVDEGWNLAIFGEHTINRHPMFERRDGVNFAKPLQVYLDLLQSGGRAKDMAAHLRSEKLGI